MLLLVVLALTNGTAKSIQVVFHYPSDSFISVHHSHSPSLPPSLSPSDFSTHQHPKKETFAFILISLHSTLFIPFKYTSIPPSLPPSFLASPPPPSLPPFLDKGADLLVQRSLQFFQPQPVRHPVHQRPRDSEL